MDPIPPSTAICRSGQPFSAILRILPSNGSDRGLQKHFCLVFCDHFALHFISSCRPAITMASTNSHEQQKDGPLPLLHSGMQRCFSRADASVRVLSYPGSNGYLIVPSDMTQSPSSWRQKVKQSVFSGNSNTQTCSCFHAVSNDIFDKHRQVNRIREALEAYKTCRTDTLKQCNRAFSDTERARDASAGVAW